ncbi:hypothetical protein [Nocardioides acrostichi]|uniref:Uncharacterized protein n=1 Tax=Nocardioides acrostichi TaxID=2784339 RepID=A0A930V1T1_9ACTN|nr:hypothetical protein [Nocardioides acrostichi]MBF4162197.1 hypothetical protein [Nocardioides acrostichi]
MAIDGQDYTTVYEKRSAQGSVSTYPVALKPAGGIIEEQVPPPSEDSIISASRLFWAQVGRRGRVEIPRVGAWRKRQVVTAELGKGVVLWKETRSTQLNIDPWSLYLYRSKSGRTALVARSEPTGGNAPVEDPGGTVPGLASDGRIYYSTASYVEDELFFNVYSVSAAGQAEPQEIAEGSGARVAGHYVAWVEQRPEARFAVIRRDVTTGEDQEIYASQDPCGQLHHIVLLPSGAIVVSLDCGATDEVVVVDDGAASVVAEGRRLAYVNASQRYVWFSRTTKHGYRQFLYSRGSGVTKQIGRGSVLGAADMAGRLVSWSAFTRDGTAIRYISHVTF